MSKKAVANIDISDMVRKRSVLERAAYRDGMRAALRMYAWWKDGEQYVGCGRHSLSTALLIVDAMEEADHEGQRRQGETK